MISDNNLNSLAIFLGSVSMLLIILYHFLEVNAKPDATHPLTAERKADVGVSVQGVAPVVKK